MSEDKITEKIYCYDHPSAYGNHDALAIAAMMNGQRNCVNPAELAMFNGGGGMGGWNNPFIYLVWMMFANRFFGNGWENGQGQQNIEVQNQLQDIRTQMQNNQNSNLLMDAIKGNNVAIGQLASNLNCDFNALQGAICDVRGGIDKLSGQVGFSAERVINAVNMGDCNIINAVKDCCCQTQQNLIRMQGDLALQNCQQTNTIMQGINGLGVGMERGFSSVSYETQKQTCDIINAGNANTQRIIDTLNSHWKEELANENQDLKFQLSQERQTRMIERMGRNGWGRDCGCGCDSGCGY